MTEPLPAAVRAHLELWFGGWYSSDNGIAVIESERRTEPGWDGKVLPVAGLANEHWAVISVAPGQADVVAQAVHGLRPSDIPERLGLMTAVFRWCLEPQTTQDVGEWVARDDGRVPEWLHPFNGDVLIEWDDDGRYGGGVGRKMHNALGHEISVGTEPSLRGRGIASRLVSTAARRILLDVPVATYMHLPDNLASAKVADRAGFPSHGWHYMGTIED